MSKLNKENYKMFINGEWVDSEDKLVLKAYNPANSEYLANFPDATEGDVNRAVEAAQEAFKTWKKTTVSERAALLNKIADIIDDNTDLLATTESLDNGKPIRETKAVDVPLNTATSTIEFLIGNSMDDELVFGLCLPNIILLTSAVL